jgi:hypothetical protein
VTAVYGDDDGSETNFTRVIHGSTSDYKIDGKVISRIHKDQEYTTPNQPSPRVLVIFFNNRWCMI